MTTWYVKVIDPEIMPQHIEQRNTITENLKHKVELYKKDSSNIHTSNEKLWARTEQTHT